MEETDSGEKQEVVKEGLFDKIKTKHIENEKKYTELFKKIKYLLPGATTAGLADTYKKRVEEYNYSIKLWTKATAFCIFIIFIFSILNFCNLYNSTESKVIFLSLLKASSISGILIWIIYFCTKRRSESKRLQEEYQHKLAVVKTYEGYRKEIKKLEEKDKEKQLMKELLNTMLKTTAYNPSVTLEKKHGDKMLLQEGLEKLIEKVSKSQ